MGQGERTEILVELVRLVILPDSHEHATFSVARIHPVNPSQSTRSATSAGAEYSTSPEVFHTGDLWGAS